MNVHLVPETLLDNKDIRKRKIPCPVIWWKFSEMSSPVLIIVLKLIVLHRDTVFIGQENLKAEL